MSDIFDGTTTPEVVEPAVSSTTPATVPTEVAELVGEGKKYKSVEDALKSVPHAQKHIQTLEEENARIKAELETRRTAEELLEEVRSGLSASGEKTQSTAPTLSPEDIEKTVSKLLERKEVEKTAQQNINTVTSTFISEFGDRDKAKSAFEKVAQDAGLPVEVLNQLAATSPEAVLKLAGITKKKEAPAGKVQSSVNTEGIQPGNSSELSARVSMVGASTKDVLNAWGIAKQKAIENLNKRK